MPTEKIECSYMIFAEGNSSFLRTMAVPFADVVEKQFPSLGISPKEGDFDESLTISESPRNDFAIIAGVVGIILFVGSRIVGKIIDDVYASKIQPKIKELLGQAEKDLTNANARKKKMYWFGVWHDESRVLVLVAAVGSTYEEILNQDQLIVTTHLNAKSWIDTNGRQNAIHLYVLENGQTNITPTLFNSLSEARAYIEISVST